ncbi:flavin-containing monooxygenase [Paenibacillus sp. CN-4]|uniref:flavin-containing monooxygenase n=1 Tax=Paenibacillus nanchangensis TaxID=3348343 RepID=UPI00397CA53A
MIRMYDVLIIGAGQAGLAAGYDLKQSGMRFLIVDAASSVGDSWRNRYDSLHLFTPRMYDGLPGKPLKGDRNGLPDKDEIADYLEKYAQQMELPVRMNCKVVHLSKAEEVFYAETTQGRIEARNVIVATGPFQIKNVPSFSESLSEHVTQLHSSEYKNPSQLKPGTTLIVGGGNSGAQIAAEIALESNQSVSISISSKMTFKPLYIMNQSIFWFFEKFKLIQANTNSRLGKWLRNQPEYVYGYELRELIKKGRVSVYTRASHAINDRILFEDDSELKADNIIWATGFKRNDSWIDIAGALDATGVILHTEGVSPVKGLYYIGLPWQTSRGSALLGWVKYDAHKIVHHILSCRRL